MSPHTYHRQYTPSRRPAHRFGNPYFRSRAADRVAVSRVKNSASRVSFKVWMYTFLIGIIITAIIWLICFSSFLTISKVEVVGARDQRVSAIEQEVWDQTSAHRFWVLSQSHLFLFNSKYFNQKLLDNFVLANVTIKRKLPGTLEINVIEKTPVAVWFEADSYYIVDTQGWIIDTVPGPVDGLVTINNNGQPRLSNKHLDGQESLIQASTELKASLDGTFSYLKVNQLTRTDEQNTLTLVLKDGPMIHFATNEPINIQLERLDALLKSELKNRISRIKYIDLRFGDKVYYK